MQVKNVVAGRFLGRAAAVIKQRADPGIGPHNVIRTDRRLEIFTGGGAQIGGFVGRCVNFVKVAFKIHIGRTDQCEITFIGNGEDHPVIGILEYICAVMVKNFRHYDVAALDQPDFRLRCRFDAVAYNTADPGAGGVDQHAGLDGLPVAGRAGAIDPPCSIATHRRRYFRANVNIGAQPGGIHGVEHDQPGIIDTAVGIFESPGVFILQRGAGGIVAQIDVSRWRQQLPPAQMIVQEKPQTNQPDRSLFRVMGQHEAQR